MTLNFTTSHMLWAFDTALEGQQPIYGYDDQSISSTVVTEYTEFEQVLLHGLGLGCKNMKILDDDEGSFVGYLEDRATIIQALVRGVLARKRVRNILLGIMAARIQSRARGMTTRHDLRQEQSSIVIQRAARGMLVKKRVREEQKRLNRSIFRESKSKNKNTKKTRRQSKTVKPEKANTVTSKDHPQEIMITDGIVEADIEETPIEESPTMIEEEAALGSVSDQQESFDEVPASPINHDNYSSVNTVKEKKKKVGFFVRMFGKIGKKKSKKSNVRIVVYEKSLEDTSLEDNDSLCFSL